jgi:AhpD family alkylhydroperoxidase
MRFIEPVALRRAGGLVAHIYGEIRRDFALLRDPNGNSPFMAHSPHPELLAALWSGVYETMLVQGAVRRADNEAIAATISRVNDCPFCVEAHALLGAVAGDSVERRPLLTGAIEEIGDERRRSLIAWAAATRRPDHELIQDPPFSEQEAPETIGEQALDGLEGESLARARLALLTALAPNRVDEATVQQFRHSLPSERDLVAAVAWPALTAARRIGSWLHRAGPHGLNQSRSQSVLTACLLESGRVPATQHRARLEAGSTAEA